MSAASHRGVSGKKTRKNIKQGKDFDVGWSLLHALWNEGVTGGQEKVDNSPGTYKKYLSEPRDFTSRATHLIPLYKPSCNLLVTVSETGKLT